jgi:hypothetical protein
MMRMFLWGLFLLMFSYVFDAQAQFKPSQQQYLTKENLAVNGGFEQGSRNWTNASGVFSVDSANKVLGDKSGKIVLTAQTLDFSQILSTGYNTQLAGLQGIVGAYVKSDVPVQMCALVDGAEVGCRNVSVGTNWDWVNYPAVLGNTSIGIKLKTLSNQTGTIYIDGASYGHGEMVQDIAQVEYFGRAKWGAASGCAWQNTTAPFSSFGIDSDCNNPTIEGDIAQATTKIPAFVLPSGSPAGTYEVKFTGGFIAITSGVCSYKISDGTISEFAGRIGNSGIADSHNHYANFITASIKYDSALTSDKQIEILGSNDSNTCQINSDLDGRQLVAEVKYYPPSSSIVRQNQVADENSVNEFNVVLTNSGSAYSVTYSDIPVIDTFPVNTSSAFTATFLSGIFTVPPMVRCTTNSQAGLTAEALSFNVTASQFQFQAYNFSGGGQASTPITCTIKKMGVDYNKSLMIYGDFAQIASGTVSTVSTEGNDGSSVTADTTPVKFTEVSDNKGSWSGDTFTAQEDGRFVGIGKINATAASTFYLWLYVDRGSGYVKEKSVADTSISGAAKGIQFIVDLEEGDKFQLKTTTTLTLSNDARFHWLEVQKFVSEESLVKNLNDNNNVKCQTKYLTANYTGVSANIPDISFSNIVIGKRYSIHGHFMIQETGGANAIKEWYVRARNGSTDLANALARFSTDTFMRETRVINKKFTATDTTVDFFQIYNGNTMTKGGQPDFTFAQLCELPDNYIETTEF